MNDRLVRNIVRNIVSIENAVKQHCFNSYTIFLSITLIIVIIIIIIDNEVCKYLSICFINIYSVFTNRILLSVSY